MSSFNLFKTHALTFSGKYFLDTEFNSWPVTPGKPEHIKLISIGMTSDDGRDFYAVSNQFKPKKVQKWVKVNVLPLLGLDEPRLSNREIRDRLLEYIGDDPNPRFYAKNGRQDWKLLCRLFDGQQNLPPHFRKWFIDLENLCTRFKYLLPLHPGNKHNALADAHWLKNIHTALKRRERQGLLERVAAE